MTPVLDVRDLSGGYGDLDVLSGVSLTATAGEIVAVVGTNGAGKTTLMLAIAGLIRPKSGRVLLEGDDIAGTPAHRVTARGLALVPEGGRLFPFMTVEENLELGGYTRRVRATGRERLAEVMEMFPILKERRAQLAGKLSGGERQVCAIARAMMSRPRVLLLDEPSVGLSPLMAERVFDMIGRLSVEQRLTILLVEQRVSEALETASRAYVLDQGRIIRAGSARELAADQQIQATYMGL